MYPSLNITLSDMYTEVLRLIRRHPSYLLSQYLDLNLKSNLYHIILHKSEFHSFIAQLNQNIFILACSGLMNNEHAHFVAHYSTEKFKFTVNFLIPPTLIEDKRKIYFNFLSSHQIRHDLVCNASFDVSSLQTLSMNAILKSLNYLHNIDKLNLPTFVQKQLFERSQHYYSLPDYSRKKFKIRDLCFPEKISAYKKDFVVWTQERKYRNILGDDLFLYQFKSPDGVSYNCCFKCMKFMMDKRNFCKKTVLYKTSIFHKNLYVKRPEAWCHICKQVPLFYILKDRNVHKNEFYKNVKIDYYENGIIVKTYPRKSSRIKNIT